MPRATDYIVNILGNAEGMARARREVTGQFQRMRQDGRRTFSDLRRNIFDVRGALFGLAGAVSFSAVVAGAQRAARELQQVRRNADALGTSVEQVQELNFIFSKFSLESDDVGDALNTLADRALDAQQGTKSFIEDFQLVGIEVDDLRNKRPAELFELFVDRIGRVEDPTRRTAAAVRIFGDDLGRKLLPFLIQGREGLEKFTQMAHDNGAVLSGESVDAAADAAEAFSRLSSVFSGSFNQAVADNAGEFADLADTLASPRFQQSITALVSGLSTIAGWLVEITTRAGEVGTSIGEALGEAVHGLGGRTLESLNEELAEVEERIRTGNRATVAGTVIPEQTLIDRRNELREEIAGRPQFAPAGADASEADGPSSAPQGTPSAGSGTPDGADDNPDRRAQQIAKIVDRLREEVATTGTAARATEIYRLEKLGASEQTIALARNLLDQRAAQKAAADATAVDKEEQAQAAETLRMRNAENAELIAGLQRQTELEQLGARERAQALAVDRLNIAATSEQAARVRELAGELFDLRQQADDTTDGMTEFAREAARGIQSALADFLFDPFEEGLDGMLAGFAETIQRMLAEAAAAELAGALFGEGFSGGGNLGGLVGQGLEFLAGLGGGSGAAAGTGHTGAVIGQPGPSRRLPARAWSGAPRLHRGGVLGLAPDEVPFIGLKGERVLSRAQTRDYERGSANVTVQITTPDPGAFRQSSGQVQAQIGAAVDRALRRNR